MIFHLITLLIFGIAINGHEDFHAEPHIRQIPGQHNLVHLDDDNNADNEIPVLHNYVDGLPTSTEPPPTTPPPIPLPVVNRPLQVTLLAVIMTAAVFANGSVIANISRDSLKLRMVHFLLIRHVCIADCVGAMLVLPVPLVAIYQGEWRYGDNVCAAVSTTTASLWTMHLLAVALYRGDRVLAVWLPTGRYPIFSVRTTNIGLVIIWVGAILGSYGATITFGHTFQPALALCIPNVPLVFFIIVFAGYCIGLVSLTTGYVLAFARRRRRKRKREKESRLYAELGDNTPFEPTPGDLIEEIESCGASERGRHRRALSDQYSASKTQIFTPSAKLTHRRVWSESAAAYCQSNLTSIVARSTQMSCDSSSFPQNSSDTNFNDYDRLTEDDGSSDFSVRKLTHSVSFDGSTTSQAQPQQQQQHQPSTQAPPGLENEKQQLPSSHSTKKSSAFAQSKSFDQADLGNAKHKNNIRNHHFNSMTMYDSVVRSEDFKGAVVGSSDKIFTSNLVIKPSSKSGLFEDVTCELKDCNVLPRPSSYSNHQHDTQLYHYNERTGDSRGAGASGSSSESPKKTAPLSPYSWLDNTVTVQSNNNNRNSTIGVILERPGSNCDSSDSVDVVLGGSSSGNAQRISGRDANEGFSGRSAEYKFTIIDPNAISLAEGSSSEPERAEGNNNSHQNKRVNFNGRRGGHCNKGADASSSGAGGATTSSASCSAAGPSDNSNPVVIVPKPRKSRPRTRVKHFRPKGKSGPAKRAIASYAVSVGHLLLYLPAMFVVGLKGATLPPGAALFCGLVVYCEFIVQPVALLLISPRLRIEVIKTIYYFIGRR